MLISYDEAVGHAAFQHGKRNSFAFTLDYEFIYIIKNNLTQSSNLWGTIKTIVNKNVSDTYVEMALDILMKYLYLCIHYNKIQP